MACRKASPENCQPSKDKFTALDKNVHAVRPTNCRHAMSLKTILPIEDNPSDIGLTRRALERRPHRHQLIVVDEQSDPMAGYDPGVNSSIRKPVDFGPFAHAVEQPGLYWLVLNEAPSRAETG
jgi:hypothetical protein